MGCQSSKSIPSTGVNTPSSTLPPNLPAPVSSSPSQSGIQSTNTNATTNTPTKQTSQQPIVSSSSHSVKSVQAASPSPSPLPPSPSSSPISHPLSPKNKNIEQVTNNAFEVDSIPENRAKDTETSLPIKLIGNLSNPVLLQILQVVCSEKSYHESIHRIHIEKVMQKQDYISCEINGKKIDQTIFLSYLCLLSKAVPIDESSPPTTTFLPPLIPIEDTSMISSITNDNQIHCEFIVNYFYSDLEMLVNSLEINLKEYLPTLMQWIQPSTDESNPLKDLFSSLAVKIELYSNQIHADFTHMLISFSYDSNNSSEQKSLFHQTIYTALRSLFKYSSNSAIQSQFPSPPSPFDRITSRFSLSTSHCYPYSLLILYAKRFILSNWKGLQTPFISSPCTLQNIHFSCQVPSQRHDDPSPSTTTNTATNTATKMKTKTDLDIEIINDTSVAFQRFLNGFRFHHFHHHHYLQQQQQQQNNNDNSLPLQTISTESQENSSNDGSASSSSIQSTLFTSQTLIDYIHQFGGSSTPPYSFGYHGTNFLPHIQSIFSQGFNPLLRNAQLFGNGEYFARPGYEDCAAIYSGKTNMLILSALILSDELNPPPSPPLSSSSSSTLTPPSPPSSPRTILSPYYVIPNPNPKSYGVTGRFQFVHDYFTYCMPLIIINWKTDTHLNGSRVRGEGIEEEEDEEEEDEDEDEKENEKEEEDWIFDYNHHKDPKDLVESFPSIYSPSVRSHGGDSESGIWTNKSTESHQYSALSSQYNDGGDYSLPPAPSLALPSLHSTNATTSSTLGGPLIGQTESNASSTQQSGPRRLLSSLNSYQFPDSDEEDQQQQHQHQRQRQRQRQEDDEDEDDDEDTADQKSDSNYSPPIGTDRTSETTTPRNSLKPSNQLLSTQHSHHHHQRILLESSSTAATSISRTHHYSRSYTTQEDDEEDERRYALLKLKSLIKKQESFVHPNGNGNDGGSGDSGAGRAALERGTSNAWFDSIF